MTAQTVITIAAVVAWLALGSAIGFIFYRLGRRDGLEEKTWLADLPPVALADPNLTALDLRDTTDNLIYQARHAAAN
jgi:hypothetical protein